MFSWAPYAFVRITIVFIAGILLGIYLPDCIHQSLAVILFITCGVLFLLLVASHIKGTLRFLNPGIFGIAAIFLAGYIQVLNSTESRDSNHIIYCNDSTLYYQVVVVGQPQKKENSWKVNARVTFIQGADKQWKNKNGKVLLYLSRRDFSEPLQYGDVLLIKGKPEVVSEPSNPAEFDYKRFLTFRKTYHQHFLRKDDVQILANEPTSMFMAYAIRIRIWADHALHENITGEREQAIASALVLGVTDGLDNELLGAYSATGAMHVLAVSGLHVGIIYMLISLILKPLNRSVKGKWTLAIISILVLWMYAFVTGLSPSVLRAVAMFSFVALARPWGQRTNIYNTLAASAFCLLIYEPYLIMSVGFQLSYLAVVGIVYLQPMLYRMWEPRSILLDKIWLITSVSIAAQVATFSLGLLYFHQFPVYFLFSNLFVIPGSFAVLVLGIVVILTSFIAPVASVVGFVLEKIIMVLNWGVFTVEAFPYSLIDHVFITTFQCWLLMAAILSVFFLIEFRKFPFAVISMSCVIIFSLLQWNHFATEINKKQFVVYNVSGQRAFDLIDNGKAFFFSDSMLQNDEERIRFHIRPNRLVSGIHVIHNQLPGDCMLNFKGCKMIRFEHISILEVYDKEFEFPSGLSVDYLLVSNNAIQNIKAVSALKFGKLILDSSNSAYIATKVLEQAKSNSLDIHSVLHQGAFITKL
jgi:competence protein ComEC